MRFFTIENRNAKVSLNDVVTKYSADELIEEMSRLYGDKSVEDGAKFGEITACAENALETLNIEINSPGGSVLDGHRIYQELIRMKDRGVRVVATINALAASMGSVIAMAADEIRMVKGARMMIHEAAQSVHGDSRDHARSAQLLDSMSGEIAEIYANKSGHTVETMREMMLAETWLSATEAKDFGLVDAVQDGDRVDTKTKDMALGIFTDKEAKEQITALEAQIATHDEAVEAANLARTQAEADTGTAVADLIAAREQSEALQVLVTSHEAEIETLTATVAERDETIAGHADDETRIAEEAATQLATVGHEPVAEVNEELNGKLTREDYEAQSAAISDPTDRARFRLENMGRVTD